MRELTLERLNHAVGALTEVAGMVRIDTEAVLLTRNHVEIIRHYNHLRLVTERIKLAREALNDMEEDLSRKRIPDVMGEHGIKTIHIEDVGRVTVSYRFGCSMPDKEAGLNWLKENGHGGIITENVHHMTLAAFAKSHLEEGYDLPDDIFKTSTSPYTSITRVS
jgi:hypothetical protein